MCEIVNSVLRRFWYCPFLQSVCLFSTSCIGLSTFLPWAGREESEE